MLAWPKTSTVCPSKFRPTHDS